VHGTDGHSSGRRRREDEAEFSGDLKDKELAKRSGEEKTEERTHQGESENATKIGDRALEQTKLVHGRESGDEETRKTTSTSSSGLYDTVFLRTKVSAQDWDTNSNSLEKLADTETGELLVVDFVLLDHEIENIPKNGSEHRGTERETGLQTEVDVRSIHKRSKTASDNDSTEGEGVGLRCDALENRKTCVWIGPFVSLCVHGNDDTLVRHAVEKIMLLVVDVRKKLSSHATLDLE